MANRRMLSKSISISKQVLEMSEFAQLLFTWTIPHLDDFGKIDGDPEIIKALVMPLHKRPVADFEAAINEMYEQKLINRYEVEDRLVIEYTGFERHQTGLQKRTKSKYPNPLDREPSEKFQEIPGNSSPTEQNVKEEKRKELNSKNHDEVADDTSNKWLGTPVNPNTFLPENKTETATLEAWKSLEPDKELTFKTTYLWLLIKGLPAQQFYQFSSEIKQDSTVENKGAVFRAKALAYLKEKW